MFYSQGMVRKTEIAMERQPDRDAIAEEAVGQKHGSAPPYAAKHPEISQEEAARKLAKSSGAQASTPEKTAESVGERVGDAYSDPQSRGQDWQRKSSSFAAPREGSPTRRGAAESLSHQLYDARFATVVASFALGYAVAMWLHKRINAYSEDVAGPFQITRPPQGDRHPRGFVEATVLKAITEHPQGMTSAEIVTEVGAQGIGQQPISDALGTLVQAKKITSEARGGKYFPAAAEVPTAPDQPSS